MGQRAFVLLGGLRVIVRNWRYLTELKQRGYRILVVTAEQWRAETLACMAQDSGPGSLIDEAEFVAGSVTVEGSYTAGVVAAVRRWQRRFTIAGVFAVGEMMVEQTGLVADALGLPSPGLRATRACRSKYLQRLYLPRWAPPTVLIPPGERGAPRLDGVAYPAVLKPASRRSSSGVRAVHDEAELRGCLDGYGEAETLLVERYVTGVEYSVETLVQHGRTVFESLTRKVTNEVATDRFVELGHTVPSPPGYGRDRLLAAARDVLSTLDFRDGVAHTELRLTASGEVVLMEVAARTPGDGILPLYQLATGEPMEPAIIRIALGEPAAYPAPRRCARQVYLEHEPGVLRDVVVRWPGVSPHWVGQDRLWPELDTGATGDPPALRAVLVSKQAGARLGPLCESDDRAVTFLIDAPDQQQLDELEKRVRAAIDIVVE